MFTSKSIQNTLHDISKRLDVFVDSHPDPGLLTGYGGSALFFAYYYRLTGKEKYLDKVYTIIEKMAAALVEKELLHSYCSGIAGIAWCIQHLSNEGFINLDGQEGMFEEIDTFLFEAMMHDLDQGHYDFMHLGLGIATYFLDKPHEVTSGYLEQAVLQLSEKSIIQCRGISWPDRISEDMELRPTVYNLGLAHGVPSILTILGLMYERGILVNTTKLLIDGGVEWMFSAKNQSASDTASLYPRKVTASNIPVGDAQSRLGWCYGDLGIAMALLNTGIRLQNDQYRQEAFRIFEHSLRHRNKENGRIVDASMCHGSMGVSHIYRRAYIATGERLFMEGSDAWLNETMQMALKDGTTSFKYKSEKGYMDNCSLLEGITGIGLGLITAIDPGIVPAWDRCFLLS